MVIELYCFPTIMSNKLDLDLNSIIATERAANKSARTQSTRGRGASSSRGGSRADRRHNPLDRRQSNDNRV